MSTALNHCMERELAVLRDFTALLEEETAALSTRAEPDVLAQLAERKMFARDALANLAAERDAVLAAIGLPIGHAGTQQAADADAELYVCWQDLLAAAGQARALNERNGMLVRAHLRNAQQAVRAIRVATGADLYGADGRQPSAAALGPRLY
ncbi:flagellar protein FlgN [Verticiella sediminum]|uniref:Flagellar protein FlgN n=1 Tax=Verticiella sediminum TaxID=1247510 RepID=A0A556ATI7_9BURK|nr:flagellar protein FlgN [Verticiella sediminum]TSH95685.1 flagellar protein FlgN [Verticiella sediminum]